MYICIYVCMCMYVCAHVCMCGCVDVCVYVFVCDRLAGTTLSCPPWRAVPAESGVEPQALYSPPTYPPLL